MLAQYKFLLLVACILPNMQRASTFSPGLLPTVSMPGRTHVGRTCAIKCQAIDAKLSRRDLGLLVSGAVLPASSRKPAYAEEQKIPPGDLFTDPQGEVGKIYPKNMATSQRRNKPIKIRFSSFGLVCICFCVTEQSRLHCWVVYTIPY
jgi:hypothetical protein